MSELAGRIEVIKLARELQTTEDSLDYLLTVPAPDLRDLRAAISAALFSRNEHRVRGLAALSTKLPTALIAKVAQLAMGPMLSARVAGVLEPANAVKLAKQLDPAFVTDLSVSLDPQRAEPILSRLPQDLIVDVGRRLLERGDHITLGRFVAVVSPEASLAVVDGAEPAELLQVALFTEEPGALEEIVQRLDDETLAGVLKAAAETAAYDDLLTLLTSLSAESTNRFAAQLPALGDEGQGLIDTLLERAQDLGLTSLLLQLREALGQTD